MVCAVEWFNGLGNDFNGGLKWLSCDGSFKRVLSENLMSEI